jgi:hypothetical protein
MKSMALEELEGEIARIEQDIADLNQRELEEGLSLHESDKGKTTDEPAPAAAPVSDDPSVNIR